MKQYLVFAQPTSDDISVEFIGAHTTLEGAQAERDRCIEGDDKHDPSYYFIEEKDTPDFTFNDLFEGDKQMKLTQEQLHEIAVRYLPNEGGFATALAKAYTIADLSNQRKIEGAFGDLFVTAYRKWANRGEQA